VVDSFGRLRGERGYGILGPSRDHVAGSLEIQALLSAVLV
jgi:hypothetical protein